MDFINWADFTVFFDDEGNAKAYTSKYALKAQDICDQFEDDPDYEWEDFSSFIDLGPYAKYGFAWDLADAGLSSFEQRLIEIEEDYAP